MVLTSHIIKIFERIVQKKIVNHLESIKQFNPGQHGFRRGRSCLSQLLDHYANILNEIKDGQNVNVVYLDLAKAFHKVDHGPLLHKLKRMGIGGNLGTWIYHFLISRRQKVIVEGVHSNGTEVTSGVLQGSVLGSLLFLVMIRDIGQQIHFSRVTSFADDTRISRAITTKEDSEKLQGDLEKIYKWANNNNMKFNKQKFELIRYGTNENLKEYEYIVGNERIEERVSQRPRSSDE